ncbi:MAG: YraN family protein [Verrucomicrobiota bacterium]
MHPYDKRICPLDEFENSRQFGLYGERVAECYLRKNKYQLLTRNYSSRWGEIDLICRHKKIQPTVKLANTLVFVEVKTRGPKFLEIPSSAVTRSKQRRLKLTAQAYLQELECSDPPARFDIVEVILAPGKLPQCEVIQDAFSVA